jgi:hypothetical protein
MNGRRIRGCGVLVVLLILSLTVFACGGPGGGDGQGEAAPSSAVESTQPTSTTSSADGGQTTTSQSPDEQTTAQAGSATGTTSLADLSSYRIHTTWREGSETGAVKDEWTTEYVADPLAVHHKTGGDMDMEMIFVGTTLWTRFMDQPWNQTDLPEGETADLESMFSQEQSPVSVEEQTPAENDIQWLMGQPAITIAEGSLTPAGEDAVNGVACKRYTVDSSYSYTVTYQAPLKGSATITEATQGEAWVADQEGWPPFVVRAQLSQTTTTQVEGGSSSTETVYVEEDVTDINGSDIVIEPPR